MENIPPRFGKWPTFPKKRKLVRPYICGNCTNFLMYNLEKGFCEKYELDVKIRDICEDFDSHRKRE